MKKIINITTIILFCSIFFIACSSDNSAKKLSSDESTSESSDVVSSEEENTLNFPTDGPISSKLPTPKSNKGDFYSETEDELSATIDDTTVDDFKTYISALKDAGWTNKAKTTDMTYEAYLDDYFVYLVFSDDNNSMRINVDIPKKIKEELKNTEIEWDIVGEAGKLLPKPDSKYGEISDDDDDGFMATIRQVSHKDYNNYIKKCKDAGWNVNVNRATTDLFDAEHKNRKYTISITFEEETDDDVERYFINIMKKN